MHQTTFIIGGCRSGKSSHALKLGESMGAQKQYFVATCVPHDEEMKERVLHHQQDRGSQWVTIEEPKELASVISREGVKADLMLVDCLTLWISNLMLAHDDDAVVHRHVDRLCATLADPPCPIILVANEVGTGIVPENQMARRFRDLAGWTNQKVAAVCQQVIWMVAGIAVTIKPQRP